MTKKNYTHVGVLLDRSYSMNAIWKESIDGLNSLVDQQRGGKGQCTFSLTVFDDMNPQEVISHAVPITEQPKLTTKIADPRGNTPYYDAFAGFINRTGEWLARMQEHERPEMVVIIAVTDGLENASKEIDGAKLNALIKQQTEEYSWQFLYAGANQDAIDEGRKVGLAKTRAVTYTAGGKSPHKMYAAMAGKLRAAREELTSGGIEAGAQMLDFDDAERDDIEDPN